MFQIKVWTDRRLAYGNFTNGTIALQTNVDSGVIEQIWTPDLYFVRDKKARKHNILKDNAFLEINPSGEIMMSQRLTIISHCVMNFIMFPFDVQLCQLSIESYVEGFAKNTNLGPYI